MIYEILIEKRAEKDFKRIPFDYFNAIKKEIIALKINPRPNNSRKLHGSKNDWRIRIGNYRILYDIDDQRRVIRIFRIKHRKDVYR